MGFFREKVDHLIAFTDSIVVSGMGTKIPIALCTASALATFQFWNMEKDSIAQNISIQLEKELAEAVYPVK